MGGGRGPGGPGGGSWKKSTSKNEKTDIAATTAETVKNLWYLDDAGVLSVVQVKTGVSDGTNTEVISDQNIERLKIILKEKV
jgi:hypothetical protein